MILPIKYVFRRSFALDYILVDWLRVLRKSPGFFKVSSLTVDFTKDSEMEIMDHMTPKYLESLHLGRYKLHRTPTPEEAALDIDDPDVYDQLVMHGVANAANEHQQQQEQQQQQLQNPPQHEMLHALQIIAGHHQEIGEHLAGAVINFGGGGGGGGNGGGAEGGGGGDIDGDDDDAEMLLNGPAVGIANIPGVGGGPLGDPEASGAGLKWRLKVANFEKLTSLTISSMSVITHARKVC